MTDQLTRRQIEAVLNRVAVLGYEGIMPPPMVYEHNRKRRPYLPASREEYVAAQRAAMLDHPDEFETSVAYLETLVTELNGTRRGKGWAGSYGLKHQAERWGRDNGMAPYVANGALIAAAAHLDLQQWSTWGSLNTVIWLRTAHPPKRAPRVFSLWHDGALRLEPLVYAPAARSARQHHVAAISMT